MLCGGAQKKTVPSPVHSARFRLDDIELVQLGGLPYFVPSKANPMRYTPHTGLRASDWAYPAVLENLALMLLYGLLERLLAEGVSADAHLRIQPWMLAPLALLLALEAPALRQMIGGECLRGRIPAAQPAAKPGYQKFKPDGAAQQAAFVFVVTSAFMRVIFRMVLIVDPVLDWLGAALSAPLGGWTWVQLAFFIYLLLCDFRLWFYLVEPPQRRIRRALYWPSRVVVLVNRTRWNGSRGSGRYGVSWLS